MTSTFTLKPTSLDLRFRLATLASRTWLNPSYARVRLQSADLNGF